MKHIHHIVPKHMGGTDDPSNLIELDVEEHAEAHRKLYEEYGNEYDRIAWLGLSKQIDLTEAQRLAHLNGTKLGGKMQSKESKILGAKMQPKESKILGGKRGGKSCYEQNKGMFSLTKEEKSEIAKNTINKRWKCTETGFISTVAGITKFQKRRGIDTTKREPVD
jgi:hypothetical protein